MKWFTRKKTREHYQNYVPQPPHWVLPPVPLLALPLLPCPLPPVLPVLLTSSPVAHSKQKNRKEVVNTDQIHEREPLHTIWRWCVAFSRTQMVTWWKMHPSRVFNRQDAISDFGNYFHNFEWFRSGKSFILSISRCQRSQCTWQCPKHRNYVSMIQLLLFYKVHFFSETIPFLDGALLLFCRGIALPHILWD